MMKTTISHVCVLLVMAFALGATTTYDEYFTEEKKQLDGCWEEHKIRDSDLYGCFDEEALEACWRRVVPISHYDVERKRERLANLDQSRLDCPGFVGRDACRFGEQDKCKKDFRRKRAIGDISVCQDLEGVRDCLTSRLSVNGSCNDRVLNAEMYIVNHVGEECQTGNFNGGPCGDRTIKTCLRRMFYLPLDQRESWTQNSTLVSQTETCLGNLEANCTSRDQQRLIRKERRSFAYFMAQ